MLQQKDASCPRRFLKTYEELKKDDSIHITTILSDDTTYERICGDPTEKVNRNFNRTIKGNLLVMRVT